jgi:GH15 family glucan-1,4-alpha-glucosidase
MRIATKRNLPIDLERLRTESGKIYEKIMEEGWDGNSFVRTLGGHDIDATSLLFTLMLFVAPSDSRMKATLDRILKDLVSDSLVYRYKIHGRETDGLPGKRVPSVPALSGL